MDDRDELPLLSDGASAGLMEYFESQCTYHGEAEATDFTEDWNLSQFWYTEETADVVCREIEAVYGEDSTASVACISCPTLVRHFHKRQTQLQVTLLEYDTRFAVLGDFVWYDYNQPANLQPRLHHTFDAVIADPPYLSEECLMKTLETAKLLLKDTEASRIYLLTGEVMKDIARREAALKPVQFRPEHRNKLSNDFRLYTHHPPTFRLGGWDDTESQG